MTRKANPPPDDPAQSKRFIELAREAEATGDKKELEHAFKKVAAGKRKPQDRAI